jgi:hypothetical protein
MHIQSTKILQNRQFPKFVTAWISWKDKIVIQKPESEFDDEFGDINVPSLIISSTFDLKFLVDFLNWLQFDWLK